MAYNNVAGPIHILLHPSFRCLQFDTSDEIWGVWEAWNGTSIQLDETAKHCLSVLKILALSDYVMLM